MSVFRDARAALAEDRDYVVSHRERMLEDALEALLADTEERTENRIHYRYGVNSGTYSAFPYGVTASHEDQRQRLESETCGPVDVTKRESRTVLYGAWVEVS